MSESTILDRYQAWRTRRFLENQSKTSTWLPGWRTQRRRRILVVTLLTLLVAWLVVAVLTMFDGELSALIVAPAIAFVAVWTALQVVTGRTGDAPRDSLDEWELQRRNVARSIGLTITQVLATGAVFVALFVPPFVETTEDFTIGCAYLVLGAVLIGGCSPAMILGWTTPDTDPDL